MSPSDGKSRLPTKPLLRLFRIPPDLPARLLQWPEFPAVEAAARWVEKLEQTEEEVADVEISLVEPADILGIDLFDAMQRKMENNAAKYPPTG